MKDKLIKDFASAVEKVVAQLDALNAEAGVLSSKNAEAATRYMESVSKLSEAEKLANDKLTKAQRLFAQAEQAVSSAQSEVDSLNQIAEEKENDIYVLAKKVDAAKEAAKRADELTSQIKQLEKSRDSLTSELSKASNKLKDTNDAIDAADALLKKKQADIEQSLAGERAKLQAKIEAVEEKRKILTDKELNLVEREKNVATRESAIQVIIKRYETLYSEQGRGFKI